MTEKIGYKDIFRQKEYLKIIIASLINRFGDSVDAIASTWIVYEVTGNAAWSAIIFALNRIPTIVVTPFAGAWVEGRKKKGIMVMTDIVRAICVAIIATGYLFGFLQAWILVLTTLVISTVEAFRDPAETALTPKILEEKYYEHGMSLLSTLSSIVELVGMGLAASIIALIGTAGAIYVDMATFLLSAMVIMMVKTKEEDLQEKKFDSKEYLDTFKDGLLYVKNEKVVMFFVGVAVLLNAVLVPFNSLQAPLTSEILSGGAEVLSILGIALTIGMLIGSILYPMVSKVLSPRGVMICGGVGIGIYYIGLILCMPFYSSKWFMYAFVTVASLLLGFFVTLLNAFMQIEFMKRVEESYLARAVSIMTSLSTIATPAVGFVISTVAVFVATKWLFVIAGVLDIVICLIMVRSKVLDKE